jgi:hypothetical protein
MQQAATQTHSAHDEIRSQYRMITGVSLVSLLIIIGAKWLHFIRQPFVYILVCLVFMVDFGATAYTSWQNKMYWLTNQRILTATKARVIAVGFGLLSLIFLAFAIFMATRYYF